MGGNRRDCSKCTDADKEKYGCKGGAKLKWHAGEDEVDTCGEVFVKEHAQGYLLWKRTKEHGLPFDIGWAEHPAWMMDVIFALDDAYNGWMKQDADSR